ncbi:hypothetical protein [Kribbella sp. NPDC051137]|uniref:hypothetical protein n=1 Tax=Kribbella sp. NPDC051137 TaxID=3155045 RepID=UPI003439EDE4
MTASETLTPDRRPESPEDRAARTSNARRSLMTKAAVRAVDDPAQLAKAARIVRAALARRVLTEADLRGEIVQPADLAGGDR